MSTLSQSEIAGILRRLELDEPISVSSESLKKLHIACVTKIPFETLDIFLKRRFSLSLPELYDKIVNRRRGGYCYELNGFFYYLLQALGFDVSICNAQLYGSRGDVLPKSQHMVLVVQLEHLWLIDVGYGNGFVAPLLLNHSQVQKQEERSFRCVYRNNLKNREFGKEGPQAAHSEQATIALGQGASENAQFEANPTSPKTDSSSCFGIDRDSKFVVEEMTAGNWQPWYAFTREPKRISDFEERNHFHQTSPESVFFNKRIAMLQKGGELVELAGNQLIRRMSSGVALTTISEEQIPDILRNDFNIIL